MLTPSFVVIVSILMSPECGELALGLLVSAATEGTAVVSSTAAPPNRTSRLETSDTKPSLTALLFQLLVVFVLRISDNPHFCCGNTPLRAIDWFALKYRQADTH